MTTAEFATTAEGFQLRRVTLSSDFELEAEERAQQREMARDDLEANLELIGFLLAIRVAEWWCGESYNLCRKGNQPQVGETNRCVSGAST